MEIKESSSEMPSGGWSILSRAGVDFEDRIAGSSCELMDPIDLCCLNFESKTRIMDHGLYPSREIPEADHNIHLWRSR